MPSSIYTQSIDFSTKDGLSPGNPAKRIMGADIDTELGLIAAALNVKFDSGDRNVASGIAPLDSSIRLPVANLPISTAILTSNGNFIPTWTTTGGSWSSAPVNVWLYFVYSVTYIATNYRFCVLITDGVVGTTTGSVTAINVTNIPSAARPYSGTQNGLVLARDNTNPFAGMYSITTGGVLSISKVDGAVFAAGSSVGIHQQSIIYSLGLA